MAPYTEAAAAAGKTAATVLFDLDGTLLDTLGDLVDSANYMLKALGRRPRSDGDVRAAVGGGIRNAIERLLFDRGATDGESNPSRSGCDESHAPGDITTSGSHAPSPDSANCPCFSADPPLDRANEIFATRYGAHFKDSTRPYPGTVELLHRLRADGYRLGIVSNKADMYTVGLADAFFGGCVGFAIGQRPSMPLKPAPDMALAALRELGGTIGRAVFVGDSETDLATARNAGMPCVTVSWGYRSRESLIAAGAAEGMTADTPDAVYDLVRKLCPHR